MVMHRAKLVLACNEQYYLSTCIADWNYRPTNPAANEREGRSR
jgi:hypothetical protein